MSEPLKPKNTSQNQVVSKANLTVTDPPDFTSTGSDHRKSVLISSSVLIVLFFATKVQPEILGISVSPELMWVFLLIAHVYFFLMWRLTSPIENDVEKKLLNFRGIAKQAMAGGTKDFPSKTKAQILMIRSLPIWMFAIALIAGVYELWHSLAVWTEVSNANA